MALFLIHSLMSLSLICFYTGYFFRKRNLFAHRIWNLSGVGFNLSAAIYLLAMKYLLGGIEAHSIFPAVANWIIQTHRFFALVALIMMLVMAYSGIKRKRNLHVKLHRIFLPLYTVVYVSGLIIFQTHPIS
ncbi:hypothetical protein EHS11_17480 [Leptospira ilyithenensis]|uniref:DUF420 domain-containing protein n=2 Tax=Leptospira ilyithenensis TaxID=2484901 RepID=A0A4R9LJ76_9LEPT|nr:hypothetical protein [Leptospira ilyithenensis]TGN06926.1 hypothetical protein EHS11_17480 [Leptospira ilyithenensis]